MRLIVTNNHQQSSRIAATIIEEVVAKKNDALLGLATGSTPLGIYEEICKDVADKKADFSKVSTVNLDEYAGLDGQHNQSYLYYMRENLFDKIGIDLNKVTIANGSEEPEKELARLNKFGGEHTTDIQLLGIGSNGHVAFNEPCDVFHYGFHLVELSHQTKLDNSRLFSDISEVPTHAFTMGIGDIMKAKCVLLIANGVGKKDAIGKIIEENDVDPNTPASILKFHQNCIIIVDKELFEGLNPGRDVLVEYK